MEYQKTIEEALKILRGGGIILYPTDTIWGLGCDATNQEAVKKLMVLKGRPKGKGFIIIVDLATRIPSYVDDIPDLAWDLIELSDKPVTLVFDKGKNLAPSVYGENGSVAIRVTQSAFCQQLLSRFGRPLVSTSANLCGKPYPMSFNDINAELKAKVDFVAPQSLDTDSTGIPSSIIALGKGNLVKVIRD